MTRSENILGTMPMGRLIFTMSGPIMLSMLMQAVYNLVDSIYVARLGDDAFLALSYAYPIQTLLIAFCVGTGVAFSAVLSQRLGAKQMDQASSVVLHGGVLYFLCWLIFFLFGLLGADAYLRTCTDTPSVIAQGTAYLQVCCCLSFGVCTQFPCERILQSMGRPAGFMIIQGSGALLNIILDPILIFVFDMGVAGAAVATVIGQITGAVIGLFLVHGLREQFPISLRGQHLQPALLEELGRIAGPAILMQSLSSVMSFGLNTILRRVSETAVWVLGVYFKLQSFVFMPIFSVNNGLISIISFNYGARDRRRVSGAIRFGMLLAVGTGIIGCGLLILCASPLLRVCFNAGTQALALGIPALGLTALSFPVAAVNIILSSAFQSLGHSRYSLAISLLRYIVLLLPVALLLIYLRPASAFLCFLITEVGACLAALPMYRHVYRSKIAVL
ncbi:MATE family efflux transporter [Flintibacter faecis]|uniref:Probable multidrug resistance protein NorM n=1 Tax=Flintibacter faecis TaxID=2763047 RepID=A0A8J6IXD5_9FIRM|nr:MATE family efflux transporter [Flintibacter faecis]MBC5716290.1 MATE family efflux transporter [Flintibacter faecis]